MYKSENTCMKHKQIYYIHSCHTSINYIHACSHCSQNYIKCSQAPSRRCPAICSRSCRDQFSSCVASYTSPSLAPPWHRRTFPKHDNICPWQTYKCLLLFEWCFYSRPFPFATNLETFWVDASCGWNVRMTWGTHKHSIHTRLSLQVAWSTPCMIYVTHSH